MLRQIVLLCLLAAALAVRLEQVRSGSGPAATGVGYQYMINLRDHFVDIQTGAGRTWGPAKEPPHGLPFSARVLYLMWDPIDSATNPWGAGSDLDVLIKAANQLIFTFDAAPAGGDFQIKFEAPNLEIDPQACANGNCRCNPGALRVRDYGETGIAFDGGAGPFDPTITVGSADLHITNTYFEHAPFANQNPYLRTYRRLCVQSNWDDGTYFFDTDIYIAVTHACVEGLTNPSAEDVDPAAQARCNAAAVDPNQFASASGRALASLIVQGDTLVAPLDNLGAFLGDFYFPNSGAFAAGATTTEGFGDGETPEMYVDRLNRHVCCGSHGIISADAGAGPSLGLCIDGAKASCCGKRPYNPYDDRCCDRHRSTVRYLDAPCPCYTNSISNNINTDCNFRGSNVFVTNDNAGETQGNTGDYSCALATKWANPTTGQNEILQVGQNSFCYRTAGPVSGDPWVACDDGNLYNPGTHQCCPINGVQSINVPCPCGTNTDCPTGEACCMQVWPPGLPRGEGALQCSKFANWPRFFNNSAALGDPTPEDELESFSAPWQAQRCPGSCFSTAYEICCNGRVCNRNFDKCCNDTCCNKFTSSCVEGRRPGSAGSRYNPKDWHVWFETCSSIEHLSGRRAWFVFILPIMLLFATLLSLALVAVLARRATEHIFELTERAIVFCAVVATLLSCVYFFSPIYKNGVAIAFVSMGAILIAVARKRRASLFLVFVMVFLILYVIDPIGGNIYLSVTSAIPVFGGVKMSSLFEASQQIWRTNNLCTDYYQFFAFDNNVRDYERYDNPEKPTYGYCSRAWVTTLMIVAAVLYVLLLVLLLLAILSYVKKLGMKPVEPIELEVAYDQPPIMPMAPMGPPMGMVPPMIPQPW